MIVGECWYWWSIIGSHNDGTDDDNGERNSDSDDGDNYNDNNNDG